MKDRKSKIIMSVCGSIVVLILIFLLFLGVNLIKNRWHKLEFKVSSIVINTVENPEDYNGGKYRVTVQGTVQAWYYDFKTYQFDMSPGGTGEYFPVHFEGCNTLMVDKSGKTNFAFTYMVKDLGNDPTVVCNYGFYGQNILVDDVPRENTDIRLFLSEFTDKVVVE